MGGFDINSDNFPIYEKNISSRQKNIAIIKITISVHPD